MTYTFFFFFFRCAGNEVVKRLGLSALFQAKSDEDILKSLTDIKVSQRVTFRGSGGYVYFQGVRGIAPPLGFCLPTVEYAEN